jgi:hypothetical protein
MKMIQGLRLPPYFIASSYLEVRDIEKQGQDMYVITLTFLGYKVKSFYATLIAI